MSGVERRGAARGGAARGVGVATALLVLLQSPACASDLAREAGSFFDRRGFAISDPAAEGSGWERARVNGASLSYRGPGHAVMSWQVGCKRPVAEPKILARHLLIGLRGRAITEEGPVPVDGAEGWFLRVTATGEGRRVRMKTVTHVAGPCVHDWILVSPEDLSASEPAFDRWWSSFRTEKGL